MGNKYWDMTKLSWHVFGGDIGDEFNLIMKYSMSFFDHQKTNNLSKIKGMMVVTLMMAYVAAGVRTLTVQLSHRLSG